MDSEEERPDPRKNKSLRDDEIEDNYILIEQNSQIKVRTLAAPIMKSIIPKLKVESVILRLEPLMQEIMISLWRM